ncbi:MAG: hypothetical protein QNJ31_05745 [Candidatus Caenarcaniphilales bacterium]|nr:hypothetical protein [Candidatus Caenarcaniphilales bacterium]
MSEEDKFNDEDINSQKDEMEREDEWSLESLDKTEYLQNRKSYFADDVYKIGAAACAILVLIALYAMSF